MTKDQAKYLYEKCRAEMLKHRSGTPLFDTLSELRFDLNGVAFVENFMINMSIKEFRSFYKRVHKNMIIANRLISNLQKK